jgi:cytochrome c-type biogenesis protein CcmH
MIWSPSLRGAKRRSNPASGLGAAGLLRYARNDGLAFLIALFLAAPAFAQSALPPSRYAYTQLEDPRREAEARALMETLRCLVCQGQSIADSDADMAGDMRALVRERIAAGEEPEAIRTWLVERYGAWVSYKPTVEPLTWPLWAAPIILVALGLWLARGRFRRKPR